MSSLCSRSQASVDQAFASFAAASGGDRWRWAAGERRGQGLRPRVVRQPSKETPADADPRGCRRDAAERVAGAMGGSRVRGRKRAKEPALDMRRCDLVSDLRWGTGSDIAHPLQYYLRQLLHVGSVASSTRLPKTRAECAIPETSVSAGSTRRFLSAIQPAAHWLIRRTSGAAEERVVQLKNSLLPGADTGARAEKLLQNSTFDTVSKTVRGGSVPREFESLPLRFFPQPRALARG